LRAVFNIVLDGCPAAPNLYQRVRGPCVYKHGLGKPLAVVRHEHLERVFRGAIYKFHIPLCVFAMNDQEGALRYGAEPAGEDER
jgi:hypothetical protein